MESRRRNHSQVRRGKRRWDERLVKKPNKNTVKVSENISDSKAGEGNDKIERIHLFKCK